MEQQRAQNDQTPPAYCISQLKPQYQKASQRTPPKKAYRVHRIAKSPKPECQIGIVDREKLRTVQKPCHVSANALPGKLKGSLCIYTCLLRAMYSTSIAGPVRSQRHGPMTTTPTMTTIIVMDREKTRRTDASFLRLWIGELTILKVFNRQIPRALSSNNRVRLTVATCDGYRPVPLL